MFFDGTKVNRQEDFSMIPNGHYSVIVEAADYKATRAGTGHFVGLTLSIVGEKQNGRKIFSNFNIDNPNPTAREIGQSDFAKFLDALGIPKIEKVEHLVHLANKQLQVEVKNKQDNRGNMRAEVVKWIAQGETILEPTPAAAKALDAIPF